jgi:pimeloyl-ACP methyl ester carboxylesterase
LHIHYERVGSGPFLLLLHGIGSHSRSFRHQLADLSNEWTVVAWDAPGYGRSDDPVVPFTLSDLADQAVGLLDELEAKEAHVLGESMGGVVAQLVYHRHRTRVQSLILADTNTGGGGLPEPERSNRVRQRLDALEQLGSRGMASVRAPALLRPDAPPDLLLEVIEIMAEVRPGGYRAAAIALGETDLTPLLGEIGVPTLVIHGEQDAIVPPETGRILADSIPAARFVLIPRAGHVSNQEQPAAFNAAVRRFLTSC